MRLHNKVAIVTGGASGIGLAIAEAFADEGARVAIFDINNDALQMAAAAVRARGSEAFTSIVDVTSSDNVARGFAEVLKAFNTVDILVNNAGIFRSDAAGVEDRGRHLDMLTTPGPKSSLCITSKMNDHDWKRSIDVNLTGTFYCTREALKIMEQKKSGKIINVSSQAGISAIAAHAPNYSAAKAGIVGLTRSVAHEVAGSGISVNCIAPGYITSPTFEHGLDLMGADRRKRLQQIIPTGRFGATDEVADLAVYLAGDKASYVIGQVISINGGVVI